jgi:hypothetical protein
MDRLQFIIAIAVILFVAFGLGWLAHWLVARFSRVSSADLGEMEALARALHDAEETRDQAIAYLQSRETELTGQLEPDRGGTARGDGRPARGARRKRGTAQLYRADRQAAA